MKVLETVLYARDLAATADFYERVLGLERFSEAPGRHVFFRVEGGVLLLFDPSRTIRPLPPGAPPIPPHGAEGPGHVCFAAEAAALEDWRERLSRHGVAIESEVTWPGGGRSLYFRDPDGNSLELAEPRIWGL